MNKSKSVPNGVFLSRAVAATGGDPKSMDDVVEFLESAGCVILARRDYHQELRPAHLGGTKVEHYSAAVWVRQPDGDRKCLTVGLVE